MNKYRIAAAAASIGIGTAELLAPDVVMRLLGAADEEQNPLARTLMRAFGARNLTIGTMLAIPAGHTAVQRTLPVLVLSDLVAAVLAITRDEMSPTLPVLGAGGTATVAALVWRSTD